jgi:UDP-2,3-diacylglucosamine hydrolase
VTFPTSSDDSRSAGSDTSRALAILCGGGDFPLRVAEAAKRAGRNPLMIGVVGAADKRIEAFAHIWVHMGQLGKLFAGLKQHAISDIVIVGAMTRPEISDLRLDWGALKRAPILAPLFRGGDNGLLVGIARMFENEGVRVVGVHEIAPDLLAPAGVWGGSVISAQVRADAEKGAALIAALSPFDVGQGVIVANGRVVAIEAAEGTDAMLARVAELRATGRLRLRGKVGVLVKAPKANQDLRLDMPAVGVGTIEGAQRAGLEGIVLAAGRVLIADREEMLRAAEQAGMFVMGAAL